MIFGLCFILFLKLKYPKMLLILITHEDLDPLRSQVIMITATLDYFNRWKYSFNMTPMNIISEVIPSNTNTLREFLANSTTK